MLSLFRTNQLIGGALYLFYLLFLRGLSLIVPERFAWETSAMGFLSKPIMAWMETQPLWGQELWATALLFVQAMMITIIFRKHRLVSDDILIPGALYLLVANCLPSLHAFSPMLLANTFLLLAFDQLITTYRNQQCADNLFNVGLWIGVASFFHLSYISFLFISLLGLGSLRLFRFREVMMIISGALVPYFLAGTYWFWNDHFASIFQQHFTDNLGFLSFLKATDNLEVYVSIGVFTFLVASVIFGYGALMRRQNIPFQKRVGMLYYLLLLSPLFLLFHVNIDLSHLFILSLPVGLLLGLLVKNMNKTSAEIFHLLLLTVVILWQLKPLLLR